MWTGVWVSVDTDDILTIAEIACDSIRARTDEHTDFHLMHEAPQSLSNQTTVFIREGGSSLFG